MTGWLALPALALLYVASALGGRALYAAWLHTDTGRTYDRLVSLPGRRHEDRGA